MVTPFGSPDVFEEVNSPFELERGDSVTVIKGSPSQGGDVVLEGAEVEGVTEGGFGGEPVFEFADRPSGQETAIAGDQILEATEGGVRELTALRRQSTGANRQLRDVAIERQEPNGKFAPANTRPDSSVPPDRAPDGRFVSPDREPLNDIGRRDDGLFDLF